MFLRDLVGQHKYVRHHQGVVCGVGAGWKVRGWWVVGSCTGRPWGVTPRPTIQCIRFPAGMSLMPVLFFVAGLAVGAGGGFGGFRIAPEQSD